MKFRPVRVWQILALVWMAFLLAAIIYPVSVQSDKRTIGILQDGAQRAIPHAPVVLRDETGRNAATVITNNQGAFRFPKKGIEYTPRTYVFTRRSRSNGGPSRIIFSLPGRQEAVFTGNDSQPFSGKEIIVRPDRRTWNGPDAPHQILRRTDTGGHLVVSEIPLAARLLFECRDSRYVIQDVWTKAEPGFVLYHVSVVRSATIRGRLLASDGAPLAGCRVFAAPQKNVQRGPRTYSKKLTGATGTWEITGLPRGVYYLSAIGSDAIISPGKESSRLRAIAPAKRVGVDSGANIEITLQAAP